MYDRRGTHRGLGIRWQQLADALVALCTLVNVGLGETSVAYHVLRQLLQCFRFARDRGMEEWRNGGMRAARRRRRRPRVLPSFLQDLDLDLDLDFSSTPRQRRFTVVEVATQIDIESNNHCRPYPCTRAKWAMGAFHALPVWTLRSAPPCPCSPPSVQIHSPRWPLRPPRKCLEWTVRSSPASLFVDACHVRLEICQSSWVFSSAPLKRCTGCRALLFKDASPILH